MSRLSKYLSLTSIVLTAVSFCAIQVLLGRSAAGVVFSQMPKPFVYRVLMPELARFFVNVFKLTPETAFTLVVVFSAVALFFIMANMTTVVTAFLTTQTVLLLMAYQGKLYDMATAAFFALALSLLQAKRFKAYYLLFPFIVANRETAFLLIPLFFLVFKNIYGTLYQIVVYTVVTFLIRWHFAGMPGTDMVFQPVHNLQVYAMQPLATLILFIGVALFIKRLWCDWHLKPLLLRTAFLCIFPILTVMYFLIGESFELRVFIEAVPVSALLLYKRGQVEYP